MSSENGIEDTNESTIATIKSFTKDDCKTIQHIMESKDRVKAAQAQVRDDVKAFADRLGTTTKKLNRIITLVAAERNKGNVIAEEQAVLDAAQQVFQS